MKNKMPIFQAMYLAENVATIILDHSFRVPSHAYGVHDVMLFGSTLQGEARDIDLLVIHNLDNLRKLGMLTTYDEKQGRFVPDPDMKIEDRRHGAEFILDSMGSPRFEAFFDYTRSIMTGFRMSYEIRTLKKYPYTGSVNVPDFGYVPIKKAQNYGALEKQAETHVEKTLKQDMVLERLKRILESRGLELDSTLDLHVMHRDLLISGRAQEHRELAIQQSRDPTFWSSILESGRLYNPETQKFDMRVNDKYSGAVELFRMTSMQRGLEVLVVNHEQPRTQE